MLPKDKQGQYLIWQALRYLQFDLGPIHLFTQDIFAHNIARKRYFWAMDVNMPR